MISFHRVDDESDLEAYLSRLEQIDLVLGDLLDLSKNRQLQASVSHALTMSLRWKKLVG